MAEKMITYAKKGQSHHFRLAKAFVRDDLMVRKLLSNSVKGTLTIEGTPEYFSGTREEIADMAL